MWSRTSLSTIWSQKWLYKASHYVKKLNVNLWITQPFMAMGYGEITRIYLCWSKFRSFVYLPEGRFHPLTMPLLSGWTHVVMNYIGPEEAQGIRIYQDGVKTGSDVTREPGTWPPGDGRVVVGRPFSDFHDQYGSVDVDELLFFNEALNNQQILDIKNNL